ncbi:hypothetical protein C8J57DRAFT_1281974 [Mycena rebaudengoi]|nr:hypothetical protein C8J57DRAFT_1281974 [Mycena rebaudengoi]
MTSWYFALPVVCSYAMQTPGLQPKLYVHLRLRRVAHFCPIVQLTQCVKSVHRNQSHPNPLFRRHVPPLDIVLYAICTVLEPADGTAAALRLHERIPDLLDFATTVEFYWLLAVERAREALEDKNPGRLESADEELLRVHDVSDAALRMPYVELILQYCPFGIYKLWTRAPPSTADVTLRLCDVSPRLFHFDLTDAERERVRQTGLDCAGFVAESCAWAQEHRVPGRKLEDTFQTPDFAVAFPCEIDLATMRATMAHYMDRVEAMVGDLQAMFPEEAAVASPGSA